MNLQENLDHTLIALADPTRRALLQHLSRGPARVTELAEPFSISLNSVSKHIRLLERADLVRREKSGRDHWLTLNPEPVDEVLQWMNEQRAAWTRRLDALEALLMAEDKAEDKAEQTKRSSKPPARKGKRK
jgi:DNA-binding transcriptional ArsR family regulator